MHGSVSPSDLARHERRRHLRYRAHDIQITVNGHPTICEDLSVAGLCISHHGLKEKDQVEIGLGYGGKTATTAARVLAADRGRYSLAFLSPTYALMHVIVHYLAKRHGVSPHIFR